MKTSSKQLRVSAAERLALTLKSSPAGQCTSIQSSTSVRPSARPAPKTTKPIGTLFGPITIRVVTDPDDPQEFLARLPQWFGRRIEFAGRYAPWLAKRHVLFARYRAEGRTALTRDQLKEMVLTQEYQALIGFGAYATCELLPMVVLNSFEAWLYSPALVALTGATCSEWNDYWNAHKMDTPRAADVMALRMQQFWKRLVVQYGS